jgi:dipeptidyl aminopeptidase/acylaminoacyl peptidase
MTVEQSETEADETLEQLANLPTMAQVTVSEGGSQIALYHDFTGRNELHILDIETGELEQWSDGEVPRDSKSPIAWDPEGDRVFFHHDAEGNEQFDIHTIDSDGTVETVLETDGQTAFQDIGPDGERVLVASNHGGQMNLYVHDMTSDETTKVTDNERATHGGTFSPGGDRFAYMTNKSGEYNNFDVFVAEADGSNHRNLNIGETGAEAMPADWHPDGDRLLVVDNSPDLGRCGVYDLETDTVEWYGNGEHEEHPVGFLPDGEAFVAGRNNEATELPVLYDVETGESRLFDLPDGVVDVGTHGSYTLDDSRVVFTFENPTRRPEILAYDLDTDEYEVLLDAEYGPFDPDDFADAEYLTVESDGIPDTPARAVDHDPYEELEIGALLYDSGERPSPLIVHPHGGPRLHESKNFDVFTQFLVSRGYSVLQVNFRGSTGRGREFVEKLYGDWGGAEQGDVATVAEHVVEIHDWVDEDRIVMYGRSFGGYSAYWQAVQYPDLYDAVISWVGVSDLADMHENTMPHFKTELMEKYMGDPEENADIYEERSPVTHVENIESPLLMLHGVNDRRVPVSQARLMDEALQEHGYEEGRDYEYVELGEEGHSSSDIRRKIRVFSVLDDFLDRRLGIEM